MNSPDSPLAVSSSFGTDTGTDGENVPEIMWDEMAKEYTTRFVAYQYYSRYSRELLIPIDLRNYLPHYVIDTRSNRLLESIRAYNESRD